MGLEQFERRLERLVEGVFARAFRGGLHPVEVARRLTREMDGGRIVGVRGASVVPNHFVVSVAEADRRRFASIEESLVRDLAEGVREHARDEAYTFAGPVAVEFSTDDSLTPGIFLVESGIREAPGGAPVGFVVLPDGTRHEIGDEPLAVGRLSSCQIVLADTNVSRRHAEIRRTDGGFTVVDLGSTNGTKVNGASVAERQLVDGDTITIGTTTMRFEAS